MPGNEERGEVRGRDAGRKTEDAALSHVHPEDHVEIGLKGGRRDIEQLSNDQQDVVDETIEIND
jgi:hypothetical protein